MQKLKINKFMSIYTCILYTKKENRKILIYGGDILDKEYGYDDDNDNNGNDFLQKVENKLTNLCVDYNK